MATASRKFPSSLVPTLLYRSPSPSIYDDVGNVISQKMARLPLPSKFLQTSLDPAPEDQPSFPVRLLYL